jgi:hypothetical protein
MPIFTRTVAKGIPPRVREPQRKAKHAKSSTRHNRKLEKKRKRDASDSESSESEDSDLEPVTKITRNRKRRQTSESVESVDEDVNPAGAEVEEEDGGPAHMVDGESEQVCKHRILHRLVTHYGFRVMV